LLVLIFFKNQKHRFPLGCSSSEQKLRFCSVFLGKSLYFATLAYARFDFLQKSKASLSARLLLLYVVFW
jgi:hypothetical protein